MPRPPASGTKMKSIMRRDQIVQATLKIIALKGVGNLTTASLAREVGISEANLYRHFRSKQEIYLATVGQVQDMIEKNLADVLSGGAVPVEALKSFFLRQVALMEENSGIPRLMFSEELHVHKAMRERILKTMYAVSGRLAELVRKGQRSGSIRNDIEPMTTILMFVAMIQGLAFRWSLGEFSFSLSEEGKKTWRNFVKCILAPSRTVRSARKTVREASR